MFKGFDMFRRADSDLGTPIPVNATHDLGLSPGQVHAWDMTEPGTGYFPGFTSAFFAATQKIKWDC